MFFWSIINRFSFHPTWTLMYSEGKAFRRPLFMSALCCKDRRQETKPDCALWVLYHREVNRKRFISVWFLMLISVKNREEWLFKKNIFTSVSLLFSLFIFVYFCPNCMGLLISSWMRWHSLYRQRRLSLKKNWKHIVRGWIRCFSVCPVSLVTSTGLFSLLNDQQWLRDI